MRYLLDTDWIIHLLAGKGDAAEKIQYLDPQEIDISLITVAEIYESAFQYANPDTHIQTFRSFIDNFHQLTLNLPIVERFAEIHSFLRRR
jgi:predicted nucleic acid-binding protein